MTMQSSGKSGSASVRGSFSNLLVSRASAATVTITADDIVLFGSGNSPLRVGSVNVTADITASGANGLDTGAEAGNTFYYVWIISNGSTTAALLSTSATAPTMPTGYTFKALVSVVRNDGSSNFISFKQYGLEYRYTAWQVAFNGAITGGTTWNSVDITNYVPSSVSQIALGSAASSTAAGVIEISNDSAVSASFGTNAPNKFLNGGVAGVAAGAYFDLEVLTANTLYIGGSGGSINGTVYIQGFRLTKLVG